MAHASRVLLTTPAHLYRSSQPQLLDRYRAHLLPGAGAADALSGLLVFKDGNLARPADVYHPSKMATGLSLAAASSQVGTWLTEQRFASVTEVTGTTFSEVMESEWGPAADAHNDLLTLSRLADKQGARVVLAALSDINHEGSTLSTGSGAAVRDAELATLRELANMAHGVPGGVSASPHKDAARVIFAFIDADRWASALRKCE